MLYLATAERFEAWLESETKAGRVIRWKKVCEDHYVVEKKLYNYNPQFIAAAGYFEWPF